MSQQVTVADYRALKAEIQQLRTVLGTLIAWVVQSANSPINVDHADCLLTMLEPKPTRKARR